MLSFIALNYKIKKTSYGAKSTPKKPTFNNEVVFAFNNPLVHLGDQLFHIGIIRGLIESQIKVVIIGNSPLNNFFKEKCPGVKIENSSYLFSVKNSLIITTFDALISLLKKQKTCVLVGIKYHPPKGKRIGDYMYEIISKEIAQIGGMTISKNKAIFWQMEKKRSIPEVVIYNDFVASGLIQAKFQRRILNKIGAKESKREQYITYIGSPKEAKSKAPAFIHKDKRGFYSIKELMELFFHGKVKKSISFDTFIAHTAVLSETPCVIVPRKNNWGKFISNGFFPMSTFIKNKVTIVDN